MFRFFYKKSALYYQQNNGSYACHVHWTRYIYIALKNINSESNTLKLVFGLAPDQFSCSSKLSKMHFIFCSYLLVGKRVAAKIFFFVFSRTICKIINFAFCQIFLWFREIFAIHEIEIWAKFSRNSKEISRKTKQEITKDSFIKIHCCQKSKKKCNFP